MDKALANSKGIYMIKCRATGNNYVGLTGQGFVSRARGHLEKLVKGEYGRDGNHSLFQEEFDRYGPALFDLYALHILPNPKESTLSLYENTYGSRPGYATYNSSYETNLFRKGRKLFILFPPKPRLIASLNAMQPLQHPNYSDNQRSPSTHLSAPAVPTWASLLLPKPTTYFDRLFLVFGSGGLVIFNHLAGRPLSLKIAIPIAVCMLLFSIFAPSPD